MVLFRTPRRRLRVKPITLKLVKYNLQTRQKEGAEEYARIKERAAALGYILMDVSNPGKYHNLPDVVERAFYMRIDKIIKLAGGKWNKSAKAHVFKSDPAAILGIITKKGRVDNKKQQLQEFFTPEAIAKEMCRDVCSHHAVLEPSAGSGSIAKAALARGAYVRCYELQEEHVATLNAAGCNATACDFLAIPPDPVPIFDFVLMNPPFTKRQCQIHVIHAMQFVVPGGILRAIMPAGLGITSNSKVSREFPTWLTEFQHTIEPLPTGTFKQAGTSIETVLIHMKKAPPHS